ncbi:hypothetical protein ARTSIC4J27_3343 [Pseudarthrobacter siccitolerans]|uniref:Uncharacterized protein n=1 Tax=Pseudarthrobacter siccitolerans TaxID=861266 RepID=A0A024H644_9MICC|nr:hypothetical protein ARTSIC4J27_3343 [Pseudarthrobacter siccitolerans]
MRPIVRSSWVTVIVDLSGVELGSFERQEFLDWQAVVRATGTTLP